MFSAVSKIIHNRRSPVAYSLSIKESALFYEIQPRLQPSGTLQYVDIRFSPIQIQFRFSVYPLWRDIKLQSVILSAPVVLRCNGAHVDPVQVFHLSAVTLHETPVRVSLRTIASCFKAPIQIQFWFSFCPLSVARQENNATVGCSIRICVIATIVYPK